tara:strand:+ start:182 stop:298 length:117 start_codon:yes stop_codon:yes gene_type:complete
MDLKTKGVSMKERQLMEALISYGMETYKITRAYEGQIN